MLSMSAEYIDSRPGEHQPVLRGVVRCRDATQGIRSRFLRLHTGRFQRLRRLHRATQV